MKHQLILVAAPSGAGKTSFVERVVRELPVLVDVITYTTRPMRERERQGNPYHFIKESEFLTKVQAGFFIEWAKVHVSYYGTSHNSIREIWEQNLWGIMDIDIQGVKTFKSHFPLVRSIFILPPSIEVLRHRILGREGGRAPLDLDVRLQNAELEMREAGSFDYRLVNDDFEASYAEFKKIIEEIIKR